MEFAFEMIAAMRVDETARPIFPKMKMKVNIPRLEILKVSKIIAYSKAIRIFIEKPRMRLKKQFAGKND